MGRLIGKLDPDLVVMEVTYGAVMALIFVMTAQLGLSHFDTRMDLVEAIIAMDFVWGLIDLVIFYRSDVSAQRRRLVFLRELYASPDRESMRLQVYEQLTGTVFDALDDGSKRKAADLIMNGRAENWVCVVRDKAGYLFNAVTAFVCTLLAAIPPALCILFIEPVSEAYFWAMISDSLMLFFVGFYFSPYERRWISALWGLILVAIALSLTVFAAYLGG